MAGGPYRCQGRISFVFVRDEERDSGIIWYILERKRKDEKVTREKEKKKKRREIEREGKRERERGREIETD